MTTLTRRTAIGLVAGPAASLAAVGAGATRAPARSAAGHVIVPAAAGDGTTDDTAALQSAIDSAASSGVPVQLRPGTYLVGTLKVSSAVTVLGSGIDRTTLKARNGLDAYVIAFSGGPPGRGIVGARFADFSIDGNGGGQAGGSASGGIRATGAVQCHFDRLHVYSCLENGLSLQGIPGGAFGHHNRVDSCLFDNSGAGSKGPGRGVQLTSSDENFISCTDFEFLGGTGGTNSACILDMAGLQIVSSCCFVGASGGHTRVHGVMIRDANRTRVVASTFDGIGGTCVFIAGTKNVVASNMMTSIGDQGATSNTASGIHLEYGARANVVTGNSLESAGTAGRTRSFIREGSAGAAGFNAITGNTMSLQGPLGTTALELAGTGSSVAHNVGPVPAR